MKLFLPVRSSKTHSRHSDLRSRSRRGAVDGSGFDWLGVGCSVGCAIHCAAIPIVTAIVPSLPALESVQWLANPLFHQVVAILCLALVAYAIWPAWKQHRDSWVACAAVIGLGLLGFSAFVLPDRCCESEVANVVQADRGGEQAAEAESGSMSRSNKQPMRLVATPLTNTRRASESVQTAGMSDWHRRYCSCKHCRLSQAESAPQSLANVDAAQVATRDEPSAGLLSTGHWLAPATASTLVSLQPYLSPIGGLFLVVAHLLNIIRREQANHACSTC